MSGTPLHQGTSSTLLVTNEQTHAPQRKANLCLRSWPLPAEPTTVPTEPPSWRLMGYVRGLVTLTPVKEPLGVQFRRGALLIDQTLASMPPCWKPHECFSKVLLQLRLCEMLYY
ncbi:hypothetical protein NQZ68_008021 [Dissostichus eleginoides]|nr:hypothetical protein NQZ68_008021 [Dissostichus eleginoides]